jgi:CrcB protein
MLNLLYIALGGAGGALARYFLATHVHSLWSGLWPLGTLLVNVTGSLLIGGIFVLLERGQLHADWRSIVVVGFLGAFTTFSTFSLETVELWQNGATVQALLYALASVCSCVLAAAAGMALTRTLMG